MQISTHASESSFEHLADQMWQMLKDMEGQHYFCSHAPHSWTPRLNLYETADRFVICVELAGMRREQIGLRVDNGVLHIRGTRGKPELSNRVQETGGDDQVGVLVMEIDSGRFHRKVPVPPDVIVEKVAASYRNGYLWIDMPRAENQQDNASP